MEWRKLKNIILLILVCLNVALAVLVGGPEMSDYYRNLQADRDAVSFLEKKGISFADVTVPDPAALPPKVVERDREQEAQLARKLLGENAMQEARGGEVYRYTSELGVIQFHSDGSFWAKLTEGAFPLSAAPQNDARLILELMDFVGEITAAGESSVTVRQMWQGTALLNQQATVLWNEKGITEITAGRRIYGTPVDDLGRETITQATALIDFYNELNQLGDVCSRVDGIIPGYISATSLNRQMELTPVWRITTDTGAYQLNLVSGGLERAA